MAFLKCMTTCPADGVRGTFVHRNILCESLNDVLAFNANAKSTLNYVCSNFLEGDVFNVFTLANPGNRQTYFNPKVSNTWAYTGYKFTCVGVARDQYSDKVRFGYFVLHKENESVSYCYLTDENEGILPETGFKNLDLLITNAGDANSGGGDTVNIDGEDTNFQNKAPGALIDVGLNDYKSHKIVLPEGQGLSVVASVIYDRQQVASEKFKSYSFSYTCDLSQADDAFSVLPPLNGLEPTSIRVGVIPAAYDADLSEKPVFQLKAINAEGTVLCDDIKANTPKNLVADVGDNNLSLVLKTQADAQQVALITVTFS